MFQVGRIVYESEFTKNNLTLRMLLKSGADANLAMADGRTPIHIAAESGNIGVIKLLLENEANILATDQVSQFP